jgi:phosphate starvation-inducible PhoH-like protein
LQQLVVEKDFLIEEINPVSLFGVQNEHLNLIRDAYPDVKFVARGTMLKTMGEQEKLEAIGRIIAGLMSEIRRSGGVDSQRLLHILRAQQTDNGLPLPVDDQHIILYGVNGKPVRARTPGQQQMVQASTENDIVFAIGPAGTGKTYTAVALAVRAYKEKRVKRIVLCRPAVEAGESLGYLPGDLKEKIDPYLRPLYDALEDMILREKLKDYIEKNIIEIVPLAYMRGRTLNNAFILLDEAQNATELQMKMFLTRLGTESKIFVTGDHTQIDLPRSQRSGLLHSMRLLQSIKGIGFVHLTQADVVRHKLVSKILAAYEAEEQANSK